MHDRRCCDEFHLHWLDTFAIGFEQAIVKLPTFANIHRSYQRKKGETLQSCCGFIDGTVRPISCPGRNQRVMYIGQKKVHSNKFQSIVTPNGLIVNLYGPVERKRHVSTMLEQSQVFNQLQRL